MAEGTDWMVVCPYYSYSPKQNEQVCESPLKSGTVVVLRFPSAGDMRAYRKTHCECDYHRCPIARANDEKYK